MSTNTVFPKLTSINFTVKNNLPTQTVTIFNCTLFPGDSQDLLALAEISEADIRHALIKGDLAVKLRNKSLVVVSSTIDLMQFDPEQQQFLIELGLEPYGVKPEAIVEVGDSMYLKLDPIADEDAPNGSMYIAEDGQLSFKDENGDFGPVGSDGGGTGPYPYIQFVGEHDPENNPHSAISTQDDGSLVFTNFQGNTHVVQYADGGINPWYVNFVVEEGNPSANNTLFVSADTGLTFKSNTGELIPIGSGGSIDIPNLDLDTHYLRSQYIMIPTSGNIDEGGNIYLNAARSQVFWQTDASLNFILNLPSNDTLIGDVVYVRLVETVTSISIVGPGTGSTYPNGDTPLKFTMGDNGDWHFEDCSEDDVIKGIHATAFQNSLSSISDNLKFNYKRLNQVQHPYPTYNHGATTVGWSKSQFLRTIDMTLSVDDTLNEGSNRTYTMSQKPYQSFVNITKDNFVNLELPRNPDVSDMVVDVYVEPGAACVWVDMPYDDEGGTNTVIGGNSIERFIHADGGWQQSGLSEEEWINAVNKHAVEKSGATGILFGTNDVPANISGTYNGNLIVIGVATIAGPLTINGDLLVTENLYNAGGYEVSIMGTLTSTIVDFTLNVDGFAPQRGMNIGTDLVCQNFVFPVVALTEEQENDESLGYPYLNVNRDVFVSGVFNGYGLDNAPGLQVGIDGNATIHELSLSGGAATSSRAGGNAGTINVRGDLRCSGQVQCNGGNTSYPGMDAGGGGQINVWGSAYDGGWQVQGGLADGGWGGNAGSVTIRGNAFPQYIVANGGDCNSTNPDCGAGGGGDIRIYGDLHVSDSNNINNSGGTRYGALSSAPSDSVSPASAGQIRVGGNLTCLGGTILSKGGGCYNTNYGSSDGGSGGIIEVKGDLLFIEVDLSGGVSQLTNGGYGGQITVYGDTIGYGESLLIHANGGDGGSTGGDAAGNGGNAGTFRFYGKCVGSLEGNGGSGWQGNGGQAGNATVLGEMLTSSINLNGGSCNSAVSGNASGNGGTINVFGSLRCNGSILLNAGNRNGDTTEETDNGQIVGGQIYVSSGDLYANGISASGCGISTTYKNGTGGQGGSVTLYNGNLNVAGNIDLSGGDSAGGNGGKGGTIDVQHGAIHAVQVTVNGGSSFNAGGNNAIGDAGALGNVNMFSGGSIGQLNMLDGANGNASTESCYLTIGDTCSFQTINMTDRENAFIVPTSQLAPVTLTVNDFQNKKTLNFAGTPGSIKTVDLDYNDIVNEGGIPVNRSSIFKHSGDTWFVLTGSIIGMQGV